MKVLLLNPPGKRVYIRRILFAGNSKTKDEVLRREILSYSSIWGEEIARYAFIYLAWVGASAAVKGRSHIRIDVLLHYLSDRLKALVYLFGDICMLALAILALYTGLETLEVSIRFGSVTHGLRISLAW